MTLLVEEILNQFAALKKGKINFHITAAALYPNAFNQVLLTTYRVNNEMFDDFTNVLSESPALPDLLGSEVRSSDYVDSYEDGDIVRDVYLHLASN